MVVTSVDVAGEASKSGHKSFRSRHTRTWELLQPLESLPGLLSAKGHGNMPRGLCGGPSNLFVQQISKKEQQDVNTSQVQPADPQPVSLHQLSPTTRR